MSCFVPLARLALATEVSRRIALPDQSVDAIGALCYVPKTLEEKERSEENDIDERKTLELTLESGMIKKSASFG